MMTWKMQMFVTLVIAPTFATFLAFHETRHLKLKVLNLVSHSVHMHLSVIIWKQICDVFFHMKLKKYLEKPWRRSNFVLEKSEKPDFCMNPAYILLVIYFNWSFSLLAIVAMIMLVNSYCSIVVFCDSIIFLFWSFIWKSRYWMPVMLWLQ